jgi:hypothetical protein
MSFCLKAAASWRKEIYNMAKASFDPIVKWFRGRVGGLVFRRAHNGNISVYPNPDMTRVTWSAAQKEHRRRMGEASKYASAAIAEPEVRAIYVQMALDQNKGIVHSTELCQITIIRAMICSGKSTWAIW